MKKVNIFAGIIGIALSVYVIITASGFPENNSATDPGAGFFPIILGVITGVLCLALIITSLLGKGKDITAKVPLTPGMKRAFLGILMFLAYCILFKPLGFILDTMWMIFVCMYLLQNRKYLQMIIVSIVTPSVIYAVFALLLYVQLPTGLLSWLL